MTKKDEKRPKTQADASTIADLSRAIEDLVLRHKQPGEGIMIEARQLARKWTVKDQSKGPHRPLFDETSGDRTLLLVAIVVALRRDHQDFERIHRHFPKELEVLSKRSLFADFSKIPFYLPEPSAKQKYEDKRRRWNRSFFNSIEYQFGGGLETDLPKLASSLFLPGDSSSKAAVLSLMQTCLDDIFAGESINMQRLEDLFYGIGRHRLAKLAKQTGIQIKPGPSSLFDHIAVRNIKDALLSEKNRKKRKRRGRPPRKSWLHDAYVRSRVLRGMEARIQSIHNLLLSIVANEVDVSELSDKEFRLVKTILEHFRGLQAWKRAIAEPFFTVLRRHLPESGKKLV